MLMIGTAELAKRLYEAWRAREDLVHPVKVDGWESGGRSGGTKPRPKWEHLDSLQQGVWLAVAEEAALILTDAMGAA